MQFLYSLRAEGQLDELPTTDRVRIMKKLDFYQHQENPLSFAKRLTGHEAYRFRIGDFRVIFEVSGRTVYILAIAKRDGAYDM